MIKKHPIYTSIPVVMLLGATTGWVDALTFQFHDGRFAAFQTGNIIQAGIHASQLNFAEFMNYFTPIIFFMIGAGINFLVKTYFKNKHFLWQQLSLLLQILGIVLATILEKNINSTIFIALLAMAMALQADSFTNLQDMPITTVFSTGNVRTIGSNLMAGITGHGTKHFQVAGKVLLVVLGFALGAVFATLSSKTFGHWAMFGAALILLIVFITISFESKEKI